VPCWKPATRLLTASAPNRLEAGTDLFGAWLVQVTYGRIGTPGRRLRYVTDDEDGARKVVHQALRRRATAKKRIGVSYRFRELTDPWQWLSLTAEGSAPPVHRH
jgi:hypothetical protein